MRESGDQAIAITGGGRKGIIVLLNNKNKTKGKITHARGNFVSQGQIKQYQDQGIPGYNVL